MMIFPEKKQLLRSPISNHVIPGTDRQGRCARSVPLRRSNPQLNGGSFSIRFTRLTGDCFALDSPPHLSRRPFGRTGWSALAMTRLSNNKKQHNAPSHLRGTHGY